MRQFGTLALEGLPATGKTTVAAALADRHGAHVLCLPDSFRDLRRNIDLDRARSPVTSLLFYLAATAHMAEAMAPERLTILDRWLPSVLALAETRGLARRQIAEIVVPIARLLPRPTVTVVLTADMHHLRGRTSERVKSPDHETPAHTDAMTDDHFALRWGAAILNWSDWLGESVVIDTTSRRLEDVVAEASYAWGSATPSSDWRR